jgi:hypothetical protein
MAAPRILALQLDTSKSKPTPDSTMKVNQRRHTISTEEFFNKIRQERPSPSLRI